MTGLEPTRSWTQIRRATNYPTSQYKYRQRELNSQPLPCKGSTLPVELCRYSGTEETWTLDPLLARQVLSQLSYDPNIKYMNGFKGIRTLATWETIRRVDHYTMKPNGLSFFWRLTFKSASSGQIPYDSGRYWCRTSPSRSSVWRFHRVSLPSVQTALNRIFISYYLFYLSLICDKQVPVLFSRF